MEKSMEEEKIFNPYCGNLKVMWLPYSLKEKPYIDMQAYLANKLAFMGQFL